MASQAPRGGLRRLAIAGPSAVALARLRGSLVAAALAQGSRVLALAPDVGAGGAESLLKLGADVAGIALRAPGFTLFRKRRAVAVLAGQLRDFNPETLLVFGADVTALCVLAARRAKVPHVAVLVSEIRPAGIPKRMRTALRAADTVIAHNGDDERALRTLLAGTKAKVVRVAGCGADLRTASGCAMPAKDEPVIFLAASRLDRVKGVHDFLEAARICKERGLNAKFVLAGPDGREAGAIKADTLARYAAAVTYVGDRADVVAAIQDAHVFVSPSHLEGMPPAVLSALAAGRVIVASDIAGSRETVDEMVNGTLVPPSNPAALADGFARIISHRELLSAMGRASRAKAERMFAMPDVNDALLKALAPL